MKIDFKPGDLVKLKEPIRVTPYLDNIKELDIFLKNYYSTENINTIKKGNFLLLIGIEEESKIYSKRIVIIYNEKLYYTLFSSRFCFDKLSR